MKNEEHSIDSLKNVLQKINQLNFFLAKIVNWLNWPLTSIILR